MKKIFLVFLALFVFSVPVFAGVDINTATQSDLEGLKGIGPAKAKAIIEYRNKIGSFKSVEELAGVSGIGAGTVRQLGDKITVQNVTANEEMAEAQ
jgi:competence protein ComEA